MNAFDPQEFAVLLKKLIGTRAIQDFATEAGVSKYQVSRRLSCALITPPRKSTLKLFASHAQSNVTYAQLLKCCGYPPEEEEASAPKADSMKIAKACLLAGINDLHLSVRLSEDSPSVPCDFELILGSDPEIVWDICCLHQDLSIQAALQIQDEKYLALMHERLSAYAKFSFLTGSRELYNSCADHAPQNLNANVTAVLYCADTLDILEEKILSVSDKDPLPSGSLFSSGGR